MVNLFKKVKSIDWIIFFIFPTILVLFSKFPNAIFKLDTNNIKLWQIITNSFVHQNNYHYVNNLGVYFLFGIIAVVILSNYIEKQKLWFLFWVFAILPIINSILHIIGCSIKHCGVLFCGSSVIISAIVFFVLSWYVIVVIKNHHWKLLYIVIITTLFGLFQGYYLIFGSIFNLGHLVGICAGIIIGIIFGLKYKFRKVS